MVSVPMIIKTHNGNVPTIIKIHNEKCTNDNKDW